MAAALAVGPVNDRKHSVPPFMKLLDGITGFTGAVQAAHIAFEIGRAEQVYRVVHQPRSKVSTNAAMDVRRL